MRHAKWHTQRDPKCVTIARELPARFDVSASAEFPLVRRARLAHQIRQDMWRALQHVRGFSPVVQVQCFEGALSVTAGGRLSTPISARVSETIEELLNDTALRTRWINHAKVRMV